MTTDDYRVSVMYGLGACAVAELPESELRGLPVVDVIGRVSKAPQTGDSARRTAEILDEIMRSRHNVDIEIANDGDLDDANPGKPVSPREPLLPANGRTGQPDRTPKDLGIRVSEPYVGGADAAEGVAR